MYVCHLLFSWFILKITNLLGFNRLSSIPNQNLFDFLLRKFEIAWIQLGSFTMRLNFPSILQLVLRGSDTWSMLVDYLKMRSRIDTKRYIPNLTIINHILLIILSL
jgi:hypothetical protein